MKGAIATEALGSIRGDVHRVPTSDGLSLYAEVDDMADPQATVVFVHGYCMTLDCWHYQRAAFRNRYRTVLYDHRSHGRSLMARRGATSISHLGRDLRSVIDHLAPQGPVVLVGHSMGGMTIMALAEEHPEFFAQRVSGVALVGTTASRMKPHRTISPMIPDRFGMAIAPRVIAGLAMAPGLVDSAREGTNIGHRALRQIAFGKSPRQCDISFTADLLSQVPYRVMAEFYPNFPSLNRLAGLAQIDAKPSVIIGGTEDKLTSIGRSRQMAALMPNTSLVECVGSGHMMIMEADQTVNRALHDLVERSTA